MMTFDWIMQNVVIVFCLYHQHQRVMKTQAVLLCWTDSILSAKLHCGFRAQPAWSAWRAEELSSYLRTQCSRYFVPSINNPALWQSLEISSLCQYHVRPKTRKKYYSSRTWTLSCKRSNIPILNYLLLLSPLKLQSNILTYFSAGKQTAHNTRA